MSSNLRSGANCGPLMTRGHRLDATHMGFHLPRSMQPCNDIKDLIDFRDIIKLLFLSSVKRSPYGRGQAWIEALGFALMTAMP